MRISISIAVRKVTQRNNVPASSPKEYFLLAVFIPYLDCLIQQLDLRFSDLTIQGLRALCLIPSHLYKDDEEAIVADDLYKFYSDDLPFPQAFHQEIALWKTMWNNSPIKPNSLVTTIADRNASPTMFPNITTIIKLLLFTSVTSSGVERANSSLRFIKNVYRSTMGEDSVNVLYVHKDIELNIDSYGRKYPRRMLLIYPICEV